MAKAYAQVGEFDRAWQMIVEAQSVSERTAEHSWHAELRRIGGEILVAKGADAGDAETLFQQAIQIARRQGAKSLELRAALSLARLLIDRSRSDEARDLLAPVYSEFSEGFETSDLLPVMPCWRTWRLDQQLRTRPLSLRVPHRPAVADRPAQDETEVVSPPIRDTLVIPAQSLPSVLFLYRNEPTRQSPSQCITGWGLLPPAFAGVAMTGILEAKEDPRAFSLGIDPRTTPLPYSPNPTMQALP